MRLRLKNSPYRHMLKDKQFRLWLENLERGSVITASEYGRRMGNICKAFNVTPRSLAEMGEKEAGNFLLEVVSHYENNGNAGTDIKHYMTILKSWWSFNDIEVRKKIKIRGSNDNSKYENERVPTQDEFEKILNVADIRAKEESVQHITH